MGGIIIFSRENIRKFLQKNPQKHFAVIISEALLYPHNKNEVSDLFPLCKDYLNLEFNDNFFPDQEGGPAQEHIAQVLEWIKDKPNELILVACRAGISRSSAIAYLIECQRASPEEAVKILNKNLHYPNELILYLGTKIMGDQIIPPVKEFLTEISGYSVFE